jgi:hypothetical protein
MRKSRRVVIRKEESEVGGDGRKTSGRWATAEDEGGRNGQKAKRRLAKVREEEEERTQDDDEG